MGIRELKRGRNTWYKYASGKEQKEKRKEKSKKKHSLRASSEVNCKAKCFRGLRGFRLLYLEWYLMVPSSTVIFCCPEVPLGTRPTILKAPSLLWLLSRSVSLHLSFVAYSLYLWSLVLLFAKHAIRHMLWMYNIVPGAR